MKVALKWLMITLVVGVISGLSSALFMVTLNFVTDFRVSHTWPIVLLPFAGVAILWCYDRFLGSQETGPNELLKNYRVPERLILFRSGVLIYVTTLLSHLVGASVGREGTAVQLSTTSSAPLIEKFFKLSEQEKKGLILTGMAGGFGGFFGVPFAGALFALELVRRPKVPLAYAPWVLMAALLADFIVNFMGVPHLNFPTLTATGMTLEESVKLGAVALCSGAAGYLYLRLHSGLNWVQKMIPLRYSLRLRMAAFSLALMAFFFLTGPETFAGLGVPFIEQSFDTIMPAHFWIVKLILTAACLSFGFKGGEVTPLFFVGATLGSAMAGPLSLPIGVAAGVGLLGVFSAVLKIPWTTAMMGVELFGASFLPWAFVSPMIAYLCSGKRALYSESQLP